MISVVIPAHNEEDYIGGCIRAVRRAAEELPEEETEIVVVCNRCTDGTAALAAELGARVIENGDRSIYYSSADKVMAKLYYIDEKHERIDYSYTRADNGVVTLSYHLENNRVVKMSIQCAY